MKKTPSEAYLEKARQLPKEEAEDEELNEWREKMAELRKKMKLGDKDKPLSWSADH